MARTIRQIFLTATIALLRWLSGGSRRGWQASTRRAEDLQSR